jgi:hypothetical protein
VDWQPIETAPKDGTEVLITGKFPNGVWFTEISWFNRHKGQWPGRSLDPPTHWMPLPAPPFQKL